MSGPFAGIDPEEFPWPILKSRGGKYKDEDFIAGMMTAFAIGAMTGNDKRDATMTVPSESVRQIDLIAMANRYALTIGEKHVVDGIEVTEIGLMGL